jgi:hypothetical protein
LFFSLLANESSKITFLKITKISQVKKKLIIKSILNNQDEVMVFNCQPKLLKICDHTNNNKSLKGVKHAKNDVNMLIACVIIDNLNSCNFEPKSPQINGASIV